MTSKQLVKVSNIIGIISIILLVYWVFTFVTIEVFGLKVFRQNMTETFYLSVMGILALMAGALIVNIMFNLTRIADKSDSENIQKKSSGKLFIALILLFPIIAGLLFLGDFITIQKKEKLLIKSAKSIIENNKTKSEKLLNYSFSKKYVKETGDILEIYQNTDKYFPNVAVIVSDTIGVSKVYLTFDEYYDNEINDSIKLDKKDYMLKTSQDERDYLEKVFSGQTKEIRYTSNDGNYEMFYPYIKNNKKVVLFFSDYHKYGK